MRKLLRYSFLLALPVFISSSAMAWGLNGHRIIAEIAQRHLSKRAARNLEKLIGRAPLAFWSNWPDYIKSDTTDKWKQTGPWHYVDVPGHLSEADFKTALENIKEKSLYSQIPEMESILSNKKLPLEQRQIALRFLIHFIGDLHQPLHVGRDEDAGGNKIQVTWFGHKTNLHTVWDSELVDYQKWSYTEYATNIDTVGQPEIDSIQSGSLEDWFYQSHELSDEIYDRTPAGSELSYQYNYIFFDKLNRQLLDGGLRLAKILNQILG